MFTMSQELLSIRNILKIFILNRILMRRGEHREHFRHCRFRITTCRMNRFVGAIRESPASGSSRTAPTSYQRVRYSLAIHVIPTGGHEISGTESRKANLYLTDSSSLRSLGMTTRTPRVQNLLRRTCRAYQLSLSFNNIHEYI